MVSRTSAFALPALLVAAAAHSATAAVRCVTTAASGNAYAGDLCDLPYSYGGERFDSCTTNYNGVASCPTKVNLYTREADADSDWAPCACEAVSCVTVETEHSGDKTIPAGVDCSFPFEYLGETYYSCAKSQYRDQVGLDGWCAVGADESGTGWGWAQWGDCSCTGTGGGIPPPPPPPSPSPSPWVPSPPGPPGPFPPPSPSPSPPAPGTGNSEATEVDAVAAGFGGFAAVVVSVSLLLIAYRKHRRSRDDIGDLAPRSFEKQALLGNYGKAYGNPPMEQSNASYGASGQQAGMPYPPNPLGIPDMNRAIQPHPGSNSKYPSASLVPTMSAGPIMQAPTSGMITGMNEDDWVQTEAAAAKMRSCFVEKAAGERIGLRLLNFMGRNTRGVCVVGVKPDSAGANSGVEEGDMIVEINGHSVLNLTHEQVLVHLAEAGNSFNMIVSRG